MTNYYTSSSANLCYPNIVLKSCLPRDSNHLNICNFNANSLFPKIVEVRKMVSGSKINIIGVTETWLTPSDTSRAVYISGFTSFRQDRPNASNRGGGVVLYIKKRFKSKVICRSSVDGIEYIFVEICLNNSTILVGCVYLPYPSVTLLNVLKKELVNLNVELYEDVIVLGDFNINLLVSNSIVRCYLSILNNLSLAIVNDKEPTHFCIPTGSSSLIDHIIIRKEKIEDVCVSSQLLGFSHHDIIFASYKIQLPKESVMTYSYRDYKRCNLQQLYEDTYMINWDDFYLSDNVDEQADMFTTNICDLLNVHLPLRRFVCKDRLPWFDPTVEKIIVDRDLAHLKWRRCRSPANWVAYKKIRNRVVYLSRLASRKYSFKLLDPKLKPKELWANFGKLGLTDQSISSGNLFSPDEFNQSFRSSQTMASVNTNQRPIHTFDGFSFKNISVMEVLNSIAAIKSNSTGSDNIPPKFIKMILFIIVPQITYLFNAVLTKSCFPKVWKSAKIIPIPKKSTPNDLNDYRPISILPFLSKALEKVIKNQICIFLNDSNFMSPFQSGFRKNHSTTTALLKVTGDIRENIDCRKLTFLLLLDLSKAFDTVDWHILCDKLCIAGFSTTANKLIFSYITDRTQYVFLNGQSSSTLSLVSGVPQGSILGPLLFSIFINDLPSVLNCSLHMFADDVQLYLSCKPGDVTSCVANLNHELDKVSSWVSVNKLCLNIRKTQAIVIYCSEVDTSSFPPIVLQNQTIPYVSKVRNLGVTITSTLDWTSHINLISSKVFFILRRLYRFAYLTPPATKLKLAKALLVPQLIYCDIVLGSLDAACFNKLKLIFNAITRYVSGIRKYDHISDHKSVVLGCTFSSYLKFRCCLALFRLLHKKSPAYLIEKFTLSSSSRTNNLVIPKFKFKHLQSSFVVYGSGLWNSLPHFIKHLESEAAFRAACFKYFSFN